VNRILLRATLAAAAAAVAVLLAVFGVLEWHDLTGDATATALQQANSVSDVLTGGSLDSLDSIRAAVARTPLGADGDLGVYLPGGETVGSAHAAGADVVSVILARQPETVSAGGGEVRLVPVPLPDGSTAVVETYLPTWSVLGPWLMRMGVLVVGGVLAAGVAALVGRWRTKGLVDSVRAIVGAAGSVGRGRSGIEIPASSAPEVNQLIGLLNAISVRVEGLIASEREFVADLSHRLRTPLTALRLDSESIGDGPVAERVRHAVMALEADVDDLIRTAARVTALGPATCDAAKVVRDRMAFWATLAEHQGRRCEFDSAETEALVGLTDKDVGAVVDALLGNVFQHTPAGTPIAAAVVRYAGWVTLVVEDGGPGIVNTATALRRGASGRGSTGLGLDIARHAVVATGGTIHIDRGRLGGARIRLRFAEVGSHHEHPAPRAWRLWSHSADLPPNVGGS
jgi:signal transduction histidine kinase